MVRSNRARPSFLRGRLVADRHAFQATALQLWKQAAGDEGVVLGELCLDSQTPFVFFRIDAHPDGCFVHLVLEKDER